MEWKLSRILYLCCLCNFCVLGIGARCLRELSEKETMMAMGVEVEVGATRHMWQSRLPTDLLADTGSCNRPTTLRPATDINVALSQHPNGNGTTIQMATTAAAAAAGAVASPAVTLANYVYQCAANRESTPSYPSTSGINGSCGSSSSNIDLAKLKRK